MPSILAKLGLKRHQPKVFVKALDTVSKTLKPGKKSKRAKEVEVVVAIAPSAATTPTHEEENFLDDGVDITNSVMLVNKLSVLHENSIQEKELDENSQTANDNRDAESMDTFIEHQSALEESLVEEKTNRSFQHSPITVIPQPADEEEEDEANNSEVTVPLDREQSSAKTSDASDNESESEVIVEAPQVISEAPKVVEDIAPVEEDVKSEMSEDSEVAPKVAEEEAKVVEAPKDVFVTNSKPSVVESIRRANLSVRPPSSNVGSLRAKFESTASKPLAPTSLKSMLAARNSARFADRKVDAVRPAEIKPIVEEAKPVLVEEVKSVVEDTKPVIEEAKPVVEEAKSVESEPIVEEVKVVVEEASAVVIDDVEPIVEEVKPVVEETKPTATVDTSAAAAAISRASDEKALFASMLDIASKPYKDQAVWFLNAYWNDVFKNDAEACERVWRFAGKFVELDQQGAKGFELDEIRAHRVMEVLAEAMTITEMRTKFHRRAKHVSLIELLIFVFNADWTQVVLAPQGSEQAMEQMQQAEALMAQSSAAVEESKQKASQAAADERRAEATAKQALESKNQAVDVENQARDAEKRAIEFEEAASARAEEAAEAADVAAKAAQEASEAEAETVKRAEASATAEEEACMVREQAVKAEQKAVEDEQRAREAESEAFRREQEAREAEQKAMEAEKILIDDQARVEAALNKVKEEEAAFQKQLADLKALSENESVGLVARRKAAHEREMLLAKDPDPLTRARIAEEAVVRKHEKQIRLATGARGAATESRANAEKSRDGAVNARIESESARSEAAIRRSASDTKATAAAEARQLAELARESATEAREESEARRKASDEALESARDAKEAATKARKEAADERARATQAKVQAEAHESEALAAKALASQSRESAENAVAEAVNAFERASQFVERVRKQASSGQGGWWWASREIEESKRYVPQRMLKKLAEQQIPLF